MAPFCPHRPKELAVRLGCGPCDEERAFLSKRKQVVAKALKQALQLDRDLQEDEVWDWAACGRRSGLLGPGPSAQCRNWSPTTPEPVPSRAPPARLATLSRCHQELDRVRLGALQTHSDMANRPTGLAFLRVS